MQQLPPDFVRRMQQQLGSDWENYAAAIGEEPSVSIRNNPEKLKRELPYERVAWTRYGYYLPQRPIFTFDPAFHAGAYYVQEASSMFIEQALAQHAELEQNLTVLDLSAAPGGKSTHLLSLISPGSLLVSNEVIKSRVGVLRENLEKWGYSNSVITNNDPQDFSSLEDFFDVIVVDAPCSGEGLFRKDINAAKEWSETNVNLCATRQQRIVSGVINALKPGGLLIYSTCTHSFDENESNVKAFADEYALSPLPIKIQPGSGIEETKAYGIYGYRMYPHKVKGEGFFCAVLKKEGRSEANPPKPKKAFFKPFKQGNEILEQLLNQPNDFAAIERKSGFSFFPAAHLDTLNVLAEKLYIVSAGTEAGEMVNKEFQPAQALANSTAYNRKYFEELEISLDEAVKYLRREPIADTSGIKGWKLATFKGLPLGFFKNIGNRTNNYYPKERRILRQPSADEVKSVL